VTGRDYAIHSTIKNIRDAVATGCGVFDFEQRRRNHEKRTTTHGSGTRAAKPPINIAYETDKMPDILIQDITNNPPFNATPIVEHLMGWGTKTAIVALDSAMDALFKYSQNERVKKDGGFCKIEMAAYWHLREIRNAIAKGDSIIEFET
jgi:hypothetical protein